MYWMVGRSTMGSSSFGTALVAGRKRVPRPAAGMTALRIFAMATDSSRRTGVAGRERSRRRRGRPGTRPCREIHRWYRAPVRRAPVRLPVIAAALLAGLVVARPALAQEGPLPPTPTNYVYARSLGMAAYRGVVGDNDAIFYNPAAMAAQRRFTINFSGLMYRVGADTDGTMFGGS